MFAAEVLAQSLLPVRGNVGNVIGTSSGKLLQENVHPRRGGQRWWVSGFSPMCLRIYWCMVYKLKWLKESSLPPLTHCCDFVPGLKAAKSQEEEQQEWHGLFESKYTDRVALSVSNRCYKAFCDVRNCTASLVFFPKQLGSSCWTSLFTFKLIISSHILGMFYLILPVLKSFQGGLPPFQVHVMEQVLFARYHRCLQIQPDVWKDSQPEHLDITANSTPRQCYLQVIETNDPLKTLKTGKWAIRRDHVFFSSYEFATFLAWTDEIVSIDGILDINWPIDLFSSLEC